MEFSYKFYWSNVHKVEFWYIKDTHTHATRSLAPDRACALCGSGLERTPSAPMPARWLKERRFAHVHEEILVSLWAWDRLQRRGEKTKNPISPSVSLSGKRGGGRVCARWLRGLRCYALSLPHFSRKGALRPHLLGKHYQDTAHASNFRVWERFSTKARCLYQWPLKVA